MSCKCQGCGKSFKMDLMVSDKIWDKIRPAGKLDDAGLLCPTCIVEKVQCLKEYSAYEMFSLTDEVNDE